MNTRWSQFKLQVDALGQRFPKELCVASSQLTGPTSMKSYENSTNSVRFHMMLVGPVSQPSHMPLTCIVPALEPYFVPPPPHQVSALPTSPTLAYLI